MNFVVVAGSLSDFGIVWVVWVKSLEAGGSDWERCTRVCVRSGGEGRRARSSVSGVGVVEDVVLGVRVREAGGFDWE